MALRRNKFEVGNLVQLKDKDTRFGHPLKVIQTFRDDINDTFCYRLEGSGWVYESDLVSVEHQESI